MPGNVVGIISRSDVIAANAKRIREMQPASRKIRIRSTLARSFGLNRRESTEKTKVM